MFTSTSHLLSRSGFLLLVFIVLSQTLLSQRNDAGLFLGFRLAYEFSHEEFVVSGELLVTKHDNFSIWGGGTVIDIGLPSGTINVSLEGIYKLAAPKLIYFNMNELQRDNGVWLPGIQGGPTLVINGSRSEQHFGFSFTSFLETEHVDPFVRIVWSPGDLQTLTGLMLRWDPLAGIQITRF